MKFFEMQKKYFGTIVNIKGFKGTLIVSDLSYKDLIIPEKTIFHIGFSEKFNQPYEVEKFEVQSKKAFLKLKNVNDDVTAKTFKEKGIFIDTETLKILTPEEIPINFTVGFDFFDENNKFIGKIIEYWELPGNDVWLVETDEGDLPVPVLEDQILEIDDNQHKITYKMIEGLFDLLDQTNDENE